MLRAHSNTIESIVGSANEALRNPAAARAALQRIVDQGKLLRERWSGLGRNWKAPIDVVPDVVVNLDNIGTINAASASNALPLKFPYPGIAVAACASVRASDTGGVENLDFRIQREGSEDMFTNGDAGTFVNWRLLGLNANGAMCFPLSRPVKANERWLITINNKDGANAHNPLFCVWFKALRD